MFAGYHNRPDATEKAFTPDGWFRTGDLGVLDQDGYLRILSRVDEMVVLAGGKNIQPEDVEESYTKSPYLREVAVLERDGRLSALVVPDVTAIDQAGAGDLNEAVHAELARVSGNLRPHERVSDYRITLDALPRTSLGKTKRHLLPDLFDRARSKTDITELEDIGLSETDRSLMSSAAARAVVDALRQLAPERAVTLDADLQADLGIDSLAWVSLTLELERRQGIYLDEAAINHLTTVRSLLDATLRAQEQDFARESEGPIPPQQLRWIEPTGPLLYRLGLLLLLLNQSILRGFFRLRVSGVDRLPVDGPFVLARRTIRAFSTSSPWPPRCLPASWSIPIGPAPSTFSSTARSAVPSAA